MEDDDQPDHSTDTGDGLVEALSEGDAARVGALLRDRLTLSRYEIELLADLFEGSNDAKSFCSHRLSFERWGPGRPPHDVLLKFAESQARGRAVQRLVDAGQKVTAAQQIVSEKFKVGLTVVKADWKRQRTYMAKTASKPAGLSDPDSG